VKRVAALAALSFFLLSVSAVGSWEVFDVTLTATNTKLESFSYASNSGYFGAIYGYHKVTEDRGWYERHEFNESGPTYSGYISFDPTTGCYGATLFADYTPVFGNHEAQSLDANNGWSVCVTDPEPPACPAGSTCTPCTATETNPCTGGGGGGDNPWNGHDYATDTCMYQTWDCMSPIVVSLGAGRYELSGASDAVLFDMNADGVPERTTWTAAGAANGFLAFDRNGNGVIDDGSELFGDHTRLANGTAAPNGFEALRELDSNRDGVVDSRDTAWGRLLVWTDVNHDGISAPTELRHPSAWGLTAIQVDYHWTGRRDRYGNIFRYEGQARFGSTSRSCYDIYFRITQ